MKSPNLFDKNVYIFSSKRPNLCEIRPLVRFTGCDFAVHLISFFHDPHGVSGITKFLNHQLPC